MEEQGLANSMVDSGAGMVSADEMKLILDEVVRLLSEGVSPDKHANPYSDRNVYPHGDGYSNPNTWGYELDGIS